MMPTPRFVVILFLVMACRISMASDSCAADPAVLTSDSLRVVTLNLAHGRKDARNQIFLGTETIRKNLLELGTLLDRAQADMIALQEADAASWWSGNFDHVEMIRRNTVYDCMIHGIHASNRIYRFGTALLSPHVMVGGFVHSFQPSRPTTTKGFTLGALDWNPGNTLAEPLRIFFVSVHLDFSRRSVRLSQIEEMTDRLGRLEGPMVVMGDFNTDWQSEDSSLQLLASNLGLKVHEPHADGLSTYGDRGARLDWILISPELEFSEYAVFPEVVSDHYAVAAGITLSP